MKARFTLFCMLAALVLFAFSTRTVSAQTPTYAENFAGLTIDPCGSNSASGNLAAPFATDVWAMFDLGAGDDCDDGFGFSIASGGVLGDTASLRYGDATTRQVGNNNGSAIATNDMWVTFAVRFDGALTSPGLISLPNVQSGAGNLFNLHFINNPANPGTAFGVAGTSNGFGTGTGAIFVLFDPTPLFNGQYHLIALRFNNAGGAAGFAQIYVNPGSNPTPVASRTGMTNTRLTGPQYTGFGLTAFFPSNPDGISDAFVQISRFATWPGATALSDINTYYGTVASAVDDWSTY